MTGFRLLAAAGALALAGAAVPAAAIVYQWQIRPNTTDSYISAEFPQPVCALANGVGKIFIFTNFDAFGGFYNASNAVRVGAITVGADAYAPLSVNSGSDPHTLPGKRWGFAATSLNSGTTGTIYLFGGKNGNGEMDDVYSYSPGTGFSSSPIDTIPAFSVPGPRSGAVAVPALGKIYLIGGQQGSTVLSQVLEFDPSKPPGSRFRKMNPLPLGLYGMRAMTKAANGTNYIYLAGGKPGAGTGHNGRIYRYDPGALGGGTTGAPLGAVIEVKDQNGGQLILPSSIGYPMLTWDPSGNVRLLAPERVGVSGWAYMHVWTLQDQYGGTGDGRAKLIDSPYMNAARARDMAGAVKCGSNTYLVGGNYGHGPSLQDRSKLVDRLGDWIVKSDVKVDTVPLKAQ